ncbi:MAG: XRE family transcriptional regulator [Roseibium sp.]
MPSGIILNDKELREAKARLAGLSDAFSSDETFKHVVAGLPPEVISQVTRIMKAERTDLQTAIDAYQDAKENGRASDLEAHAKADPGVTLIVARIAKGYSQRELAWRLGLKEQQVQRYEADRYSSISIKNYGRIASLLGVHLKATITDVPALRGMDEIIANAPKTEIRKILKHGREHGWFGEEFDEDRLKQTIAENRIQFGSPSLLRTGLNVVDKSEDILLHAWRAQVAKRASELKTSGNFNFDPLDIGWLPDFIHLSVHSDGPRQALDMLRSKGILAVAERQIEGLTIDGAAFIEDGLPVIGLTLRNDTLDNFWFTILHEIAHVILHFKTGLSTGFFDQMDLPSADEQEAEADLFAQNILIPDEVWRRSPARIAKSPGVIEKFASDLGINPAIVFGRIRRERKNYAIFSQNIGRNTVRKQLMEQT